MGDSTTTRDISEGDAGSPPVDIAPLNPQDGDGVSSPLGSAPGAPAVQDGPPTTISRGAEEGKGPQDSRDSTGRTSRATSDTGPVTQGKMEGGGRLLGHCVSSVTEEFGSLARRGKVPDTVFSPMQASLPQGFEDTRGGGILRPPQYMSRGSGPHHHQRVASAPMESATASFLNKMLGASSPFTEFRRAKARLSKFRTQLQVEISRLGGLIVRAKKSVKAFEDQSKRDEGQLVRVGMRKHLTLHRYYSSLKRTLLQLEYEQCKHIMRVLETRENEISLIMHNLKDILRDGGELNASLFRGPAELAANDMFVQTLRQRLHWLTKICNRNQAPYELMKQTLSMTPEAESLEERRRKLLHLIDECKILYFGGTPDGTGVLPHEELACEDDNSALVDDTEPGVALQDVSSSGRTKQASPPPLPPPPTVSLLKKPQFIRQREVLQLRMRCEMDFANLIEDERYREGRLLRRWFELLEGRRPTTDTFSSPVGPVDTEVRTPSSGPTGVPNQVHAPRSIVAFTNYFAIKRIMEPYRMDPSVRPVIIGLTQSLVFRRARRVVFGYVDSTMKVLNQRWRAKIRRCRKLSARAVGVPEPYLPQTDMVGAISTATKAKLSLHEASPKGEQQGGAADREADKAGQVQDRAHCVASGGTKHQLSVHTGYTRLADTCTRPYQDTSEALGEMTICLTPQEMADCLLAAMRCLHYEAVSLSGNVRPLDADTMFPILLYALIHADLPDMYSCLYCLRNFASGDHAGEKAYYITCVEAAVQHLDRMVLPVDSGSDGEEDDEDEEDTAPPRDSRANSGRLGRSSTGASTGTGTPLGSCAPRSSTSSDGRTESDEGLGWDGFNEDELGPSFSREEQQRAMAFLDQWLGVEAAMEETIDVLEADGWF